VAGKLHLIPSVVPGAGPLCKVRRYAYKLTSKDNRIQPRDFCIESARFREPCLHLVSVEQEQGQSLCNENQMNNI